MSWADIQCDDLQEEYLLEQIKKLTEERDMLVTFLERVIALKQFVIDKPNKAYQICDEAREALARLKGK